MSGDSPTFSVIVPTVGRKTLAGTLRSIAVQLEPGDEVLVVCNADGDLGSRARTSAMERAHGTHLLFIDDDDEYVPGAFAAMRQFARDNPGRIGIFREELIDGSLLWREPRFEERNVGSVMFVVPNQAGRLAPWLGDEGNDWHFIAATVDLQEPPLFEDHVVARQRPDGTFAAPVDRLRFRLRIRTRVRRLRART